MVFESIVQSEATSANRPNIALSLACITTWCDSNRLSNRVAVIVFTTTLWPEVDTVQGAPSADLGDPPRSLKTTNEKVRLTSFKKCSARLKNSGRFGAIIIYKFNGN